MKPDESRVFLSNQASQARLSEADETEKIMSAANGFILGEAPPFWDGCGAVARERIRAPTTRSQFLV